MRRLVLLFGLMLFTNISVAKTNFGSVIVDSVTSIYDGDTFRVTIKDWPPIIGERIPIRVNGIDTPEMRGKCKKEIDLSRKAKKRVVGLLRGAEKIELRNTHRGKYFRVAADVYVDGKSLGNILLTEGLAKKYFGGKKDTWCDS